MSNKLRQEIFFYFEKKIFNSFSECNLVDYLKKLTTFEDGVQVKYTIVIDAESCLDRLYGGYFSDWKSGGDWKRLHTFYNELKSTCVRHCIDMVIFFDGASVDANEKFAWLQRQFDDRCKINQIFHASEHVDVSSSGATSSPSTAAPGAATTNRKFSNWISPVFLRHMITHETQYNNDGHVKDHLAEQRDERPIKIYFSLNDYRKELLRFCSDNVHNLLFTNDLELVVMHAVNNQDDQDTTSSSQQRARLDLQYTELFWAKSFLLSQRNQIMNGKRIMYDNICSCLDLDTEQFAYLNILLGTRWFPPEWLFDFYRSITPMIRDQVDIDVSLTRMSKTVIDNIIEFIRDNGRPVDLNRLSSVLFGRDSGDDFLAKMSALRLNIDYLFNRSFDSIDLSFHRQYLPATKTLKKYLNDLSGNVNAASMGYQKHQKHHNYHHQKSQHQQQEFSQSHEPSYAKKWIDMHFCKNEKQSHLVERQLAMLNINDEPVLTFDSILKIAHTSGIRSHWIYNLLKYRELFLSVSLEPILDDQQMRIDHVYRDMRMRCYSILFAGECKQQEADLGMSASMSASLVNVNQSEMSNERCQSFVDQHQSVLYADDELVTVREYSYDTKENRVETTDINFRPQYHQSLDKLWSLTRRARLKLFIECINGNQRTEELMDMFDSNRKVNHYLIPCLVLRYMISTGLFINHQDVHVFLMTFELSFRIKDTSDKDINRKDDTKQDPDMRYKRAIHLASIFTRGIETVAFANDTCGHPFSCNYFDLRNFFEGQLFQANYGKIYFNQALSSKLNWESTKLDLKLRNILVEFATHGVEHCLLGSEGPNEALYGNRAFPVRLQRNFLNELFCINSDVSKVEPTTATKAITKSTNKTSQSTLNNHKTVYKSKSHSKNSKSFPNKKPADESRQLVQPKRGFGRGLLVMDNRRDNFKAKRSGYSSKEDSDDDCNNRRRNTGMLDSSWVTVNNRDRSPDRPKSKAQLEDEAQVSQCLEKIKVIRHNRKVKKIQQMREKAKEAGEPFPDDYDYNTDDSYENALYPYPIEHQLLHDEVNDLSDYERFVPESPFSIRYKFNPEIERLLEKESGKKITPKQPRDKRTPKTYPQFVKAQDMPIFPFSMDDLREMKQHYLERIEMEKKKKEEYEKSVAHLVALKESVKK